MTRKTSIEGLEIIMGSLPSKHQPSLGEFGKNLPSAMVNTEREMASKSKTSETSSFDTSLLASVPIVALTQEQHDIPLV